LKVHVWPEAEQERVMDPVKFVPDADMGMFTEVEPTRVVVIGEEEVRLNWAVLVPERATVWGLPVALSEMLSAPLRAPLAVGAKVTLAVQLCPGLSRLFNGAAAHVLVWRKSPLVVILVIVRTAVPVLVIVTVCGLLVVPTAWLENERLVGVSITAVPAVTPVPLRLNVCGLLAALSVIESVAPRAPVAVGVNVTFILQVPPPAFSVATQSLVSVYWVSLLVIPVIVRGAVPALTTVMVCVALGTLRAWFPKFSAAGATAMLGESALSILATNALPNVPFSTPWYAPAMAGKSVDCVSPAT